MTSPTYDETWLTDDGYVLTLASLAEAWPTRAHGIVATSPAFLPPSDDSATRADFAIAKAQAWRDRMPDATRWPFLASLLRPIGQRTASETRVAHV